MLASAFACSSDYITSDGGGTDGSSDVVADTSTCTPIDAGPIPAHGGAACVVDAAGACSPAAETAFFPAPLPATPSPTPFPGTCSAMQIDQFYNDCITGSASACSAYIGANSQCFKCLFTQSSASSWGPFIGVNGTFFFLFNLAGCISLIDPCNSSCVQALGALSECTIQACTSGVGCDDAGVPEVSACTTTAASCTSCGDYATAAMACGNDLIQAGDPAVIACGIGASTELQIKAIATVMCGPQP